MPKTQKRRWIFIETIVLVSLILTEVFIITVSSIDLEKYRPEIIRILDDSLGRDVQLGRIEFSLFPYFGVRGHNFYLPGDENTPTFSADEVIIGVYLVPLASGSVIPKKLRIISPTLSFSVEKNEKLIDKIFKIVRRAASGGGPEMRLKGMVITNATLKIIDKRFGGQREYAATLFYGSFSGNLKSGPVEYTLSLAPPGDPRGIIKSEGEGLPDGRVTARVWVKRVDLAAANLVLGDYRSLSISGTVGGDFTVTYGNERTWDIHGRITAADVRAKDSSYYPGGVRIDEIDLSGAVSMTPNGLSIREAVIRRDSLKVTGDLTLMKVVHRTGTSNNLTVTADIADFELTRDLSLIPLNLLGDGVKAYARKLLANGRLSAHIDISGNPALLGTKAARLEIAGTIADADLDLGGAVVRGVSADVSISGDEVVAKDVAFADPPGHVRELRWRIEKTRTAPYLHDLRATVDDMAFEDVKDILASNVISALPFLKPTEGVGRVRGVIGVDAPIGTTTGVAKVTGRVEFSNWALSVPFFTKTPKPGSAVLVFEKDRMKIPPFTVTFAESVLTGEGELTNFSKPRLVMSLRSPTLDLVELFGTGDKTIRITDLSSRLIFEEGYLLLEDVSCALYGGKCTGAFGYVYSGSEKEDLLYLNLSGRGTDFGALASDAGLTRDITGKADFSLSLKSDPGNPELIKNTLDGTIEISIKDGAIKRMSVLSKIMSLMKISNYLRLKLPKLDTNGIPFDSITGTFVLVDGKATTEDLFFNGRVMKVTMVGSYDMVSDNLDMVVGFQLLQTIDLIVNKIPVVGYILTGDDGNLFTTYFRVTGSLKDPKVAAMTLEGLGRGTLHIFQRIFRFPLKGFMPR